MILFPDNCQTHVLQATEMREGNNPSWFNPGEAVQVMLYCCQLAKRLYNPISPTDIGIIAPYRKQVANTDTSHSGAAPHYSWPSHRSDVPCILKYLQNLEVQQGFMHF